MQEDLFKKGKAEYKAGRYKKAAGLFLAAIRTDQESAAWKTLGMSHSHPDDFTAWYALGRCLMHLNQKEKAIQCFRNAVRISPGCKKCQDALMDATRIPFREKKDQFFRKIDTFFKARIWRPIVESFHSLRKPDREVELSDGGKKKTLFSFWNKATGADLSNPPSGRGVNPPVQTDYSSSRQATRYASAAEDYSRKRSMEDLIRERNDDITRTLAERRRQSEDEEIEELLALDII